MPKNIYISSGTTTISSVTSDNYHVGGDGRVIVSSGGKVTVYLEAVTSGGTGGRAYVYNRGVIQGDVENYGLLVVSSGGTALHVGYWSTGMQYIRPGGICSGGIVYSDATLFVSGGYAFDLDVRNGGYLLLSACSSGGVFYSGYASKTDLSGDLIVYSGATANLTYVSSGGSIRVETGGRAQQTTVKGKLFISSGGTATSNYISSGGSAVVRSGGHAVSNHVSGSMNVAGTATSNYISSGGIIEIDSGGTAAATTVSSGGYMRVRSGKALGVENRGGSMFVYGSASGITMSAGYMRIMSGGTASGTVMSDGELNIEGDSYKGTYMGGSVWINPGGHSENEVFSAGVFDVFGSGSASGNVYNGTIGSGVTMNIKGGRFAGTTVSNAIINVTTGYADVKNLNGAVATIRGGMFFASSGGGAMSSAAVSGYESAMGKMYVMSGATVKDVNVYANGHLGIMIGGYVSRASAGVSSGSNSASIGVSSGGRLGTVCVYGMLDIGSGGSVTSAVFSSGGRGHVSGTLNYAFIGSGTPVQVSSGGLVSSASVSSGGRINVNGGILYSAYVASKGILSIASNGVASGGMVVFGSALVNATGYLAGATVSSGGELHISGSGSAMGTLIASGGNAVIHNSGVFLGSAGSGGTISVLSGGLAGLCVISSGGTIKCNDGANVAYSVIDNGGKITGAYNCSSLVFSSGGIVDFDISDRAAGNASAFVSQLGEAISQSAVFTLTVNSSSQTNGKYKLASDAAGFNKTVIVKNCEDGAMLRTLKLGQTEKIRGVDYRLELDSSDVLSVSVGAAIPVPTMKAYFTGDFNGGGKDMIAKQKENSVSVYCNGDQWGLGIALDTGWDVVATGDFNGDKKDDFLRVNTEGYVVGEMSIGNGMFTPQVLNLKNAGWSILGTGDFNHNGTDDVLIANPTGASETVGLLGYWESGVTWTLINGYSAEWEMVSTGDFNGDGKCDMLWRNSFEGDGGLTYNAYCTWIVEDPVDWRMVSVANPTEWNFLCSGDFNADGSHDIAMINGEGVVGIWGVNDGYLNSWSILSAVDTSAWELAGVGDFNGDKTDDIAWRNMSTGLTGYWQINGKELTAWANIATIA